MKIAVVADKKSGHLTQCLGLRDVIQDYDHEKDCLLYTSPSPRDLSTSRMPSSA